MKILITGTPGVGKTTLSKKISEILGIKHLDLSKFIKENQLYDSYDKEFDTHIFNKKTVKRELKKELDTLSSFIIDTHSPECVSFIDFDQIYILKVENSVLYSRLKERGYTDKKIKENINCEIFGITEETVEDLFGEDYELVGEIEGCISEKKMMEKIKKGSKTEL